MGWTDLFKSKKGAAGKADPRIRWFGKLPTYADYYSSTTDEGWAVEFNDWILKGYEIYHSRLKDTDKHNRRLPFSRCAVRLAKSGMTVLASIQDYGGDMRGRPFPLVFYVGLPDGQWRGPTSDRVPGAARVMRHLDELSRDVIRFHNSPSRFDTVFGDREAELGWLDAESRDDSWLEQAGKVTLGDWYAGVEPIVGDASLEDWLRGVSAWGQDISRHESETFEATFCFPLAPTITIEVQASGWVRWLEARMDIARRNLSLFATGGGAHGAGRFAVVARKAVEAEDFLLVTPLATTLSYVDDLSKLKRGSGDDDGSAGPAVRLDGASTWKEFVTEPVTVP